jgi:replicative DNA helicase
MILGSILLNEAHFAECCELLPDDFSLESHRIIWRRMCELRAEGTPIDHVTLASALMRRSELESVDGISYIVSMEEGLPELYNLPAYVAEVREKSGLRQVIFAAREIQQRAFVGEQRSAEIIAEGSGKLQTIGTTQSAGIVTASDVIDREGGVDGLLRPVDYSSQVRFGYADLDCLVPALMPGDLVVIGGVPGSGKSAFASCIAANVAIRQGLGVALFSLEMGSRSIIDRIACSESRIASSCVREGILTPSQGAEYANALAAIYEAPLWIDDSGHAGILDIKSKIQILNSRPNSPPVRLAIVDYLQLMPTPSLGRNSNRTQEVGALSRGLKLMAQELKIPIIALSQLSRAIDERTSHTPQLSDLRESGSIEQDASIVIFIHRPVIWAVSREEKERMRYEAKALVAKQRNGPIGAVDLVWLGKYTRFESCVRDAAAPHWNERDDE